MNSIAAKIAADDKTGKEYYLNKVSSEEKIEYMLLFLEVRAKLLHPCKVGKHIAILLVDQNVKVMSEVFFLINPRLIRKNLMTFY